MAGKNGAGNTRRILILIIAVCDAVSTAALALFHDSMERGLAVALGYAILFLSAFLMNLCIAGKATSIKEISALVFSIVLLALVISAIAYILFNADDDTTPMFHAEEEERPFASHPGMGLSYNEDDTAEEEEDVINIPSPPTVFNTITINKEATDTTEPSESLITEKDDEIMIPAVPEVFGMVRDVDRESEVSIPSDPEVFGLIRDAETTEEPVAIPSVPEMFGVIREVEKESEPEVAPEVIPVEESETIDIYEPTRPDLLDDDFWSTFYIAGEELEFEDGIYYFDLYTNDEYRGQIEVYMSDQKASLEMSQLRIMVEAGLTDEAVRRVFVDNGKYISLSRLNELGVRSKLDSESYTVDLYFVASDMPIQRISLKGGSRRASRRPIGGGIKLEPAIFTLGSRYTLSSRFRAGNGINFTDSLFFSFRSYNEARLYDVYFDFDFGFDFTTSYFDFNFGRYKFYTDFSAQSIRLSWGNITTDLLSSTGTSIGIRFDKAAMYSDDNSTNRNNVSEVLVIEKESEVQVFNDGQEIYNATLQPGIYHLEDFTLYSGINHIKLVVNPLDGTPSYEKDIEIAYSNSLLARGELEYGAAVSIGRTWKSKDYETAPGQIKIPLIKQSAVYDLRNVTFSGYVTAGLTDSLTIDSTISIQNVPTDNAAFRPVMKIANELTHANLLGTTRYNFNVTERSDEHGVLSFPGFYARIGHQINTDLPGFSSFNISLAYSSPEETRVDNRHRFLLSTGFSGKFGIMSYSLNYSGTINTDELSVYRWNIGGTLSFSFSRNIFLTASLNVNAENFSVKPSGFNGRIAMTIYFGNGNVNIETTGKNIALDTSMRFGNHSINTSADLNDVISPRTYGFGVNYGYSGKIFNIGVDLDANRLFNDYDGSLSISTSSIFADGLLAFQSYVPTNYVIIGQSGSLKGNDLSVGSFGNSSAEQIGTFLDMGIYTGISSRVDSSFAIYSADEQSFSGGSTFSYNIPYSKRRGYAVRITADESFAGSGIVYIPDGSLWVNEASPLYKITENNNDISLSDTGEYIFSDSDGRFTITNLPAGTYGFDVPYGDEWILYIFTVGTASNDGEIEVFDSLSSVSADLPGIYCGAYSFNEGVPMTSDEFWSMLYPSEEEVV